MRDDLGVRFVSDLLTGSLDFSSQELGFFVPATLPIFTGRVQSHLDEREGQRQRQIEDDKKLNRGAHNRDAPRRVSCSTVMLLTRVSRFYFSSILGDGDGWNDRASALGANIEALLQLIFIK